MWGEYSTNRDITICEECNDVEIDIDAGDYCGVCGECERMMCEYCATRSCAVRLADEDYECNGENSNCCEQCMEYCEECDASFHGVCKARHLAQCTSKSRAERAASSAAQKVAETESELKEAKSELASVRSRIASLKRRLDVEKEEKAKADQRLELESKSAAAAADATTADKPAEKRQKLG